MTKRNRENWLNKSAVNPKVPNGFDNPKEAKMGEPVKPEPILVLQFYNVDILII